MQGDKWVVIIGGSSGIGFSCAKQFLMMDYHVLLVARNEQRLAQARRELMQRYSASTVKIYSCDVSVVEQVKELCCYIKSSLSMIDGVVISSGYMQASTLATMQVSDIDYMLDVNLRACIYIAKYITDSIVSRGFIVFVSSLAAVQGVYGYSVYSASKAALHTFAESLEHELMPNAVRVKVVCPPDTDTPGLKTEEQSRPELTRELSRTAGILPADRVASVIVSGIKNNRLYLWPSVTAKGISVVKGLFPGLLRRMLCFDVDKYFRRNV